MTYREPPTDVPPKICVRKACGAEHYRSGKYCSPRCNVLAWQEKKRALTKAVQKTFAREKITQDALPLMIAAPTAKPDRSLYCPPCYGDKPHYLAENGLYRCRACGRERMTPEQSRETYPAYRVREMEIER